MTFDGLVCIQKASMAGTGRARFRTLNALVNPKNIFTTPVTMVLTFQSVSRNGQAEVAAFISTLGPEHTVRQYATSPFLECRVRKRFHWVAKQAANLGWFSCLLISPSGTPRTRSIHVFRSGFWEEIDDGKDIEDIDTMFKTMAVQDCPAQLFPCPRKSM